MSARNNPASEEVRADPLVFVGLHSSVGALSHFPRQTWALAFHRGTMKQALAPFCFTLLQCSAHLRLRSRSRWADLRGLSGCFACLCRMRGRGVFPGWLLQVGGRHRAETPTMPLMHLGRTDGRIYCKLIEQTVVGRKMDNERVSPPLQ